MVIKNSEGGSNAASKLLFTIKILSYKIYLGVGMNKYSIPVQCRNKNNVALKISSNRAFFFEIEIVDQGMRRGGIREKKEERNVGIV